MNIITSILRKFKSDQNINVLTCPTHERYETYLSQTPNITIWSLLHPRVKDWNLTYMPVPKNYNIITEIPKWLEIDVVLSQNKFGQFQLLAPIAQQLNLPLITIEHTFPYPTWPQEQKQLMRLMSGNIDCFITENSRKAWGWDESNGIVIKHAVDTDIFSPKNVDKQEVVLSICNDFINRDGPCGYSVWKETVKNLPYKVLGATPGLSEPAKDINDLVDNYNKSSVFLNTSIYSPIPCVVLEAMSCLPDNEIVFFNTTPCKIQELINLQTLNQNTLGNKIYHKHITPYNGYLFNIKCSHIPKFRLTPEHPILTVSISKKYCPELKKKGNCRPIKKIISSPVFKEARNINKNDWLVFPKYKVINKLNMSKEWLEFYGLFLAEGNVEGNIIKFTLHEKENHLIEIIRKISKLLDREIKIKKIKDEKAVHVTFCNGPLARELDRMFHKKASEKSLPKEFMEASPEELEIFLQAYCMGDGYKVKKNTYSVCTSSIKLAYQLLLIYTKLNILCNINYTGPREGIIRGRKFQGKGRYNICFSPKHNKSKKTYVEDENNFYIKVNNILIEKYEGNVYNLTTEDSTFRNPFIVTHNCGLPVVSTNTCEIPNIISHGYNGFLGKNTQELEYYCKLLLNDKDLRDKIGNNARQTILKEYNLDNFCKNWRNVFEQAMKG